MKNFTLLSAFLFCILLQSQGQWSYTELSAPRKDMGSASLNSKAYFAGGNNGLNSVNTVEVYDVSTETWETIGNLSVAREVITGVTCGNKIYFAGGMDWTASYSTVDIYNAATQQWTVAQLSTHRFSMASVSHGSKVLFAGGLQLFGAYKNIVDIYDTLTGIWTTANLVLAREGIAATVVGDLAIFAGGFNYGGATDLVDIYNFTTDTWTTANLSEARSHASATTVGTKAIIAGGITSINNPTDRVDVYDASTGIWTTASLSAPRASQGNAATVNGKAWFAGGGVFMGQGYVSPSDVVDIYDADSNIWSTDHLLEPIMSHSVLGIGNRLIVAGGKNSDGIIVSLVEIFYDPAVGINSKTKEETFFTVYPNPGNGKFYLEMSKENPQTIFTATIRNLQGQVVFAQLLEPGFREINVTLPSGVYMLNLNSGIRSQNKLITIRKQ
ncbi:MAG: kelch repeat-containing protein [Bacteroidota bacterium]